MGLLASSSIPKKNQEGVAQSPLKELFFEPLKEIFNNTYKGVVISNVGMKDEQQNGPFALSVFPDELELVIAEPNDRPHTYYVNFDEAVFYKNKKPIPEHLTRSFSRLVFECIQKLNQQEASVYGA